METRMNGRVTAQRGCKLNASQTIQNLVSPGRIPYHHHPTMQSPVETPSSASPAVDTYSVFNVLNIFCACWFLNPKHLLGLVTFAQKVGDGNNITWLEVTPSSHAHLVCQAIALAPPSYPLTLLKWVMFSFLLEVINARGSSLDKFVKTSAPCRCRAPAPAPPTLPVTPEKGLVVTGPFMGLASPLAALAVTGQVREHGTQCSSLPQAAPMALDPTPSPSSTPPPRVPTPSPSITSCQTEDLVLGKHVRSPTPLSPPPPTAGLMRASAASARSWPVV